MKNTSSENSIVTPLVLCGKIPFFLKGVKKALLTYSDQSKYVFKNFKDWKSFSFASKTFLKKDKDSDFVIVGDLGIGAPAAIAACEELRAYGIKQIFSVGSAGGLQKDLTIGDIILCCGAFIEEGTSLHYGKEYGSLSNCSKTIIEDFKTLSIKKGFEIKEGLSWTTDAPYRETLTKVKHYSEKGVLSVEMESSALFSFSRFYKDVETICFFIISDVFQGDSWMGDFSSSKIKDSWQKIFSLIDIK